MRVTNQLEARLNRTAPDGCSVTSMVSGTIRGWRSTSSAQFSGGYSPDLAVSTQVSCPNGNMGQSEGRVTGRGLSRNDLEREIEARSSAFISRGGATCSYSPDAKIRGGTVLLEGVRQSCTFARGGGPLVIDRLGWVD